MKKMLLGVVGAAVAVGVLIGCCATGPEGVIGPGMAGSWGVEAKVIVSWATTDQLPVEIVIADDGVVTGTVGGATLVDGRFERNRGAIGERLNLATDYIIRGKLDGAVLPAEGIERDAVSMPLNYDGSSFVGGVHTSGTKFGGAESMVLSASGLKLERR